ncbi:MAG TPA: hypothetical protein VEV38_08230 [Candidatus Eremiobacteraceae bacterium]|nr:hypothetical protein [Candidatus Eremiobacteraceae bacterium]
MFKHIAPALAACTAVVFLCGAAQPRPHASVHPRFGSTQSRSKIVISRLDQSTRAVRIAGLTSGLRTQVYENGFLVTSGVARSTVAVLPVRRKLIPGSRIIVVQRASSGLVVQQGSSTVATDVVTYHFDDARDGWNPYETTLTVNDVNSKHFGLQFNLPLDADTMGEPLYVANVFTPVDGNTHNLIYAATENDSLFAYDADTGALVWQQSYLNQALGDQPMPISDIKSCKDIQPNVGITSTPVIDPSTNTMFLVTKVVDPSPTRTWHQYIHAVDIGTGLDLPGSPVEIQGQITTQGGQVVTFNPLWQLNRPGLLLTNGVVYVAFGSHCDYDGTQARGWIFAYNESLTPVASAVTTVDDLEGFGSIWQSGYGVASDDQGNLFALTGNGAFDGTSNFGDSALKISANLTLEDYFSPANEQVLDSDDVDFGSGGAMLLPTQPGTFPDLMVGAGKDETLYLLNRDDLGGFTQGGPDRVVQEIPGAVGIPHGLWGGPALYVDSNGQTDIYYCGGQDHLKQWVVETSPSTSLFLAQQTKRTFGGMGGTTPVISSNGSTPGTGIIWAIQRPSNKLLNITLYAYDAMKLTHQLIQLPVGQYDHNKGSYFGVPTVVNGRVYVGYGSGIAVFGEH